MDKRAMELSGLLTVTAESFGFAAADDATGAASAALSTKPDAE